MGFFTDIKKAVDDYGRKHKEHMTSQWVRGSRALQHDEVVELLC
jgi:hypothetical protein